MTDRDRKLPIPAVRRALDKVRDVMDADLATADDPTRALGALGLRAIADWVGGELDKREARPACTCGAVDVEGVELHRADCALARSDDERKRP